MGESPHGGNRDSNSEGSNLAKRIIVGAVLIPIVILITHFGGLPFTLFVALMAVLAYREFCQMFSAFGPALVAGGIAALVVCLSFDLVAASSLEMLTVVLMALLFERLVRTDRSMFARSIATTILGVMYTGWLLGHFILLRNLDARYQTLAIKGSHLVYLVLILTWSYDTFAYMIGTFLGQHRIFSKVSPSKTLEGTIAGFAGCILAAFVVRATLVRSLGAWHAVSIGLIIAVFAQIGDLVESMLKRSTGVKDSSHILPGHGGILDRFDSLLFAGPAMYLYVKLVLL